MSAQEFQKGAYEIILLLGVAIISTLLVNGLPFGRLKQLSTDQIVQTQTITTPAPVKDTSLQMTYLKIDTIYAPKSFTDTGGGSPETGGIETAIPASFPPGYTPIALSLNPVLAVTTDESLKDRFHITLTGNLDPATRQLVYSFIGVLDNYHFMKLLTNANINISVTSTTGCGGHVSPLGTTTDGRNNYNIDIYKLCGANIAGSFFTLTHELAHIIYWENPTLVTNFCKNVFNKNNFSGACVDDSQAQILPTANCRCEYTNCANPLSYYKNNNECFADMAGSYLTYDKGFVDTLNGYPNDWTLMLDFPKNFQEYYFFAQDNLFAPQDPIAGTQSKNPTSTPEPTPVCTGFGANRKCLQ